MGFESPPPAVIERFLMTRKQKIQRNNRELVDLAKKDMARFINSQLLKDGMVHIPESFWTIQARKYGLEHMHE